MAAGDAGGAIGAAMETYYQTTKSARAAPKSDAMRGSLLDYQIQDLSKQAAHALKELGGVWTEIKEAELPEQVAALLADGKIVGVARGKAEFDPRTLGNRSILAGARDPDMLQMLNMKKNSVKAFVRLPPLFCRRMRRTILKQTEVSSICYSPSWSKRSGGCRSKRHCRWNRPLLWRDLTFPRSRTLIVRRACKRSIKPIIPVCIIS